MTVRGGGDVTAAVFLAHTLTDGPRTALSRTAATMFAILAATQEAGLEEMALVAEQDAIANPDRRVPVAEEHLPRPPGWRSCRSMTSPAYPLLFGPSPVHPLDRLTAHLGGASVWAKREDVNSGIAFGGNKTRKLEYLVADALAPGLRHARLDRWRAVQPHPAGRRGRRACRPEMRARPGELGRLAGRGLRQGRQHPDQPPGRRRRPTGAAPGFGIGFKESWEQALERRRGGGGKPYAIPAGASDHRSVGWVCATGHTRWRSRSATWASSSTRSSSAR